MDLSHHFLCGICSHWARADLLQERVNDESAVRLHRAEQWTRWLSGCAITAAGDRAAVSLEALGADPVRAAWKGEAAVGLKALLEADLALP